MQVPGAHLDLPSGYFKVPQVVMIHTQEVVYEGESAFPMSHLMKHEFIAF